MMITMLAAAMTLAMLIATVFGLHDEAERIKVESKARQNQGSASATSAEAVPLRICC